MGISDDAYRALEGALGPENVSRDPGVIATYTYMNSLGNGGGSGVWAAKRPVCVVLPGSTEEVQKIVKICNQFKLRFKAHSTGWIQSALAATKNCVLLDMRRMNEIEIHADDFFVVTEPYATAGETQVETMRYGLTPHLVGAGPNASNLASATSMQGTGGGSVRSSMNERNVLAVEWVLPTGEILRLGSADTPNAGWFCGDGPGPSLRGMMRGAVGNTGGNGVFTKAALKLYPWYGPPYACEGTPPFFKSKKLPFGYIRYVTWPSIEQECDGLYAIGETEILDYSNRWAAPAFHSSMATSNEEFLEMKAKGGYQDIFPSGYWTFFFNAHSQRQFDYNVKVLEKIIRDTGGSSMDPMDLGERAHEIALQNAVRTMWIAKSAFMPTSSNTGAPPLTYETIDESFKCALQESIQVKEEWIKDDKIYNDSPDNCYACLDENGHYLHIEHACLSENWEPKAEPQGLALKGTAVALKKKISNIYMSSPRDVRDFVNYVTYMVKIQKLIDPNNVTEYPFRHFEKISS